MVVLQPDDGVFRGVGGSDRDFGGWLCGDRRGHVAGTVGWVPELPVDVLRTGALVARFEPDVPGGAGGGRARVRYSRCASGDRREAGGDYFGAGHSSNPSPQSSPPRGEAV